MGGRWARASILVLCGCGPAVYGLPTGTARAPLRAPCGVRILRIGIAEANARYDDVGRLCASLRDGRDPSLEAVDADEDARAAIEATACGLGGNVLVANGFCSTGSGRSTMPGLEFNVYAERSSPRP